jgi:cytochrome c oxidase cbb3-type subunit 4
METYTFLRQFADSWAMLALLLTFLGVIAWVMRPAARKSHDDAANLIFRNETKPAGEPSRSKEA